MAEQIMEQTASPAAAAPGETVQQAAPVVAAPVTPAAGAEPGSPPSDRPAVPESVDGYVLPQGVPKEAAAWARSNGLTQVQFEAAVKQFGTVAAATTQAQQTALRTAGEQFVESWGEESKYNLSLAKNALNQMDPEGELKGLLNTTGFGNHPGVIKFLYGVGKALSEGGFLKASVVPGTTQRKSPAAMLYGENHPVRE